LIPDEVGKLALFLVSHNVQPHLGKLRELVLEDAVELIVVVHDN
jgi:hypothetical protein